MTLKSIWKIRAERRKLPRTALGRYALPPVHKASGPVLDALCALLKVQRRVQHVHVSGLTVSGFTPVPIRIPDTDNVMRERLLLKAQRLTAPRSPIPDLGTSARIEYAITLHAIAVVLDWPPPHDDDDLEMCRSRLHNKAREFCEKYLDTNLWRG